MPTNFKPIYSITPGIAKSLMRIEAAKKKVALLPFNPTVLATKLQKSRLFMNLELNYTRGIVLL